MQPSAGSRINLIAQAARRLNRDYEIARQQWRQLVPIINPKDASTRAN